MDKGRLEENNESFDIIEENNESFYPSLIFQFSFIEAFVLKRKKNQMVLFIYVWLLSTHLILKTSTCISLEYIEKIILKYKYLKKK